MWDEKHSELDSLKSQIAETDAKIQELQDHHTEEVKSLTIDKEAAEKKCQDYEG